MGVSVSLRLRGARVLCYGPLRCFCGRFLGLLITNRIICVVLLDCRYLCCVLG